MPNMRRAVDRNRGSSNSSKQSHNSKTSLTPTAKISKYFKVINKNNENEAGESSSSASSISPYRDHLTDIKLKLDNSTDDFDAFKSPDHIVKVSKLVQLKPPKNFKAARKKPLRQSKLKTKTTALQRTLETSYRIAGDVNPDHLQMAIALSKSSYEAESSCSEMGESSCSSQRSEEQKEELKKVLEKYGFRWGKSSKTGEVGKAPSEIKKPAKKSRYKYVTPILYIRTAEERQSLIETKLSLILNQYSHLNLDENKTETTLELYSELLQSYHKETRIFKINHLPLETLNDDETLFCRNLGFEQQPKTCGQFLKNWRGIAGREPTPERELISVVTVASVRCMSPDLFGSDDEKESSFRSTEQSLMDTLMNLKDVKKSVTESGKCVDLTNSSDDEREIIGAVKPELRLSEFINVPLEHGDKTVNSEDLNVTDYVYTLLSQNCQSELKQVGGEQSVKQISCIEIDRVAPLLNDSKIADKSVDSKDSSSSSVITRRLYDEREIIGAVEPELRLSEFINAPLEHGDKTVNSEDLNVTDYVYTLLSQNCQSEVKQVGGEDCVKQISCIEIDGVAPLLNDSKITDKSVDSKDSSASSVITRPSSKRKVETVSESELESSQGSILISDDELNYSSAAVSQRDRYKKYCLSESDESDLEVDTVNSTQKIENENLSQTSIVISDDELHEASAPLSSLTNKLSNCNELGLEIASSDLNSKNDEGNLSLSQTSIVISDDELNYSSAPMSLRAKYKNYKLSDCGNNEIASSDKRILEPNNVEPPSPGGNEQNSESNLSLSQTNIVISDGATLSQRNKSQKYSEILHSLSIDNVLENRQEDISITNQGNENDDHPVASVSKTIFNDSFDKILQSKTILDQLDTQESTPHKPNAPINSVITPDNGLIVKMDNITPMPDYDTMDTPKVLQELGKFGLKPLKRPRGIKMLKYIYETTHPFVAPREAESVSDEDEAEHRSVKKRKTNDENYSQIVEEKIEIVGDLISECELEDGLIFERTRSKKIQSCQIPFQIVWHNFLACNPAIRENILLYEPLQLEVVHSMIKEVGYKFNIQDLLTFFDRKCITIRTCQGQTSQRRY